MASRWNGVKITMTTTTAVLVVYRTAAWILSGYRDENVDHRSLLTDLRTWRRNIASNPACCLFSFLDDDAGGDQLLPAGNVLFTASAATTAESRQTIEAKSSPRACPNRSETTNQRVKAYSQAESRVFFGLGITTCSVIHALLWESIYDIYRREKQSTNLE